MATRVLYVDDVSGKYKRGLPPSSFGAGIDQDFDVATPTSNFIVTQTFSAGTKLDVWVNGVLMREGVGYSYQRNVPSNRIDFTSPIQTNAWLRVRVYL